ncbi:MAG: hybrid sensor histidine kinase/response regulator [Desulfatiglandaceae bacterium]
MSDKRILVVEDDEDLVHMLVYNLSKRGYHPMSALDGLKAFDRIEAERPDLILLDILLPGMDGWQICQAVRNHEEEGISEIPIIILSALGSPQEKLKGIETGADDYIPKPFSIKEVLLKVDRLIERETKKRDLHAQVKALQAREVQRNDLQNILFHELRNQLVIIGGYSKRIAEKPFQTPEKYQHCAGVIQEYSRSLSSLTDQVLLLSRIESGQYALPVETVSFEDIIGEITHNYATQVEKKGLHLHFHRTADDSTIRLNPTAVKLALSNLIENAIKYSPNDSPIIICLDPANGTGVKIRVQDNGPGIPLDEREKVFSKFYRGKTVKGRTRGTGLGLYISKTLIESMGGTIGLAPNPMNGTCFTVVFHAESAPFRSEPPLLLGADLQLETAKCNP